MANKIQPLGNRVIIKPEEIQEKTAGGLVIPPSAADERRPAYGEVIKLGIGKDAKSHVLKFNVKIGDKVFFKKYSPEEIELNNEKYLVVEANDLIAVVK